MIKLADHAQATLTEEQTRPEGRNNDGLLGDASAQGPRLIRQALTKRKARKAKARQFARKGHQIIDSNGVQSYPLASPDASLLKDSIGNLKVPLGHTTKFIPPPAANWGGNKVVRAIPSAQALNILLHAGLYQPRQDFGEDGPKGIYILEDTEVEDPNEAIELFTTNPESLAAKHHKVRRFTLGDIKNIIQQTIGLTDPPKKVLEKYRARLDNFVWGEKQQIEMQVFLPHLVQGGAENGTELDRRGAWNMHNVLYSLIDRIDTEEKGDIGSHPDLPCISFAHPSTEVKQELERKVNSGAELSDKDRKLIARINESEARVRFGHEHRADSILQILKLVTSPQKLAKTA